MIWNKQIMTHKTIPCNKLDITLRDRKGTCLLTDVSTPTEKYKDPLTDKQRTWHVKVTPMITSANKNLLR